MANSPFLAWLYTVLSVQAVSNLIGTAEIASVAGGRCGEGKVHNGPPHRRTVL